MPEQDLPVELLQLANLLQFVIHGHLLHRLRLPKLIFSELRTLILGLERHHISIRHLALPHFEIGRVALCIEASAQIPTRRVLLYIAVVIHHLVRLMAPVRSGLGGPRERGALRYGWQVQVLILESLLLPTALILLHGPPTGVICLIELRLLPRRECLQIVICRVIRILVHVSLRRLRVRIQTGRAALELAIGIRGRANLDHDHVPVKRRRSIVDCHLVAVRLRRRLHDRLGAALDRMHVQLIHLLQFLHVLFSIE